jgi:proline dehydrogenase
MDEYLNSARDIGKLKLNASITVKLTALGALFDRKGCEDRVLELYRSASGIGAGFEIDMEGKDLVQFTLDTALACADGGGSVTLALQAYLDRTADDLKVAMENGIRPRLVKGAYLGDTSDFEEIQERFKKLAETVFDKRRTILIGTHDPELVDWVRGITGTNKKMVEFGFLKGLADMTKVDLANNGWIVSEYIPFGKNSEAYDGRRLRYLEELKKLGRAPLP